MRSGSWSFAELYPTCRASLKFEPRRPAEYGEVAVDPSTVALLQAQRTRAELSNHAVGCTLVPGAYVLVPISRSRAAVASVA